jgi:hypothetical protein
MHMDNSFDNSKSILSTIIKDIGASVFPSHAQSVISAQKSNGISADQFFNNMNGNKKFPQRNGNQEISFDVARIYKYPVC